MGVYLCRRHLLNLPLPAVLREVVTVLHPAPGEGEGEG
jgi:hypothetical protein